MQIANGCCPSWQGKAAAKSQMAAATSLSTSNLLLSLKNHSSRYLGLRPLTLLRSSNLFARNRYHLDQQAVISFSRLVVRAATEGSAKSSQSDEKIPSWARPDSDEPPPWVQDAGNGSSPQSTFQIPFYAYLLASAVAAIATAFLWYKSVQVANKEAEEQDRRDDYM